MTDLIDFISQVFDSSDFPARWHCGRWTTVHGWLHILSDIGIWSAYFAIPLTLGHFVRRRTDLPFRSIFVLFAAFILLCGTTHLMEALIFWWPAYRLAGLIKLVTASVSWLTVFALVRVTPTLLSMRSPEELEREVVRRTAEVQEAMRRVEAERELLHTTLSSIGDAVITTDVSGHITNMNGVAEALTGWSTKESLGLPLEAVFTIINEETRRPVESPALRALEEGVVVGLANHTVLIRRDGRELPIDDSAAPIRQEGKTVGCVLVFRDITERHRQQAELQARERQFVTLAESIPQLCWMANPDGHIFWYNQRWYEYTGTTLRDMEGWGWQSVHDAKVLPDVLQRWKSSIATSEPFEMVFPLRGNDGVFRPFLTRIVPLKDTQGRVVRWFGTNTDISEQKRSEEALIRAQRDTANALALLDSLVSNAPIGIAIYDRELRFLRLNPALAEMNGLPVEAHLGKPASELLPRVPEQVFRDMRSVLEERKPLTQREVLGRTPKSDEERTWYVNYFPVTDDTGGVSAVGVTVMDVTALRQAERERERVLTILEALVDAAPMGLAVIDRDGRYSIVNGPYAALTGTTPSAHIGKPVTEIAPHVRPLFDAVLGSGQALPDRIVDTNVTGDPRERRTWRESWFPVGRSNGLTGVGVIVQDITEQETARRELQFQLDLTRAITDNATTAIFMMDERSRCTFMNPAAERMTEFQFAEVANGTLHDFIHHHHPDGREYPMAECPIDRALPEQFDVVNHEDVFIRKSGQFFPVAVNAKPIRYGGRAIGTVVEVRDVTEEKETAERLRDAAAELSEANRKKDEFLATLAHELRNPLAPIRTGLHLIKLAGNDQALIEQSRRVMERQLEHMVRLVDDLLDLSRITRGKLNLQKERVSLAQVLESALEVSRPHLEAAKHHFTMDLPPSTIWVDADPTRLAQVFANLLNNSAKYTESGGSIAVITTLGENEVSVTVRDTGIGIPAENLTSIFDMFSQGQNADPSKGGLGIGLTLVKRLVEMHDGRIEVRSEGLGKGSEFIVSIPVTVGATQPSERSPVMPSNESLRILIVDDNRDAADVLSMVFQMLGHEVHVAYDGQRGIELADELRPAAIFFDIGMPKLNGYDAARWIRTQSWGKELFLVAVTGWGKEEDRRRSREAGFDHHLVKPVDVNTLRNLLAHLTARGDTRTT